MQALVRREEQKRRVLERALYRNTNLYKVELRQNGKYCLTIPTSRRSGTSIEVFVDCTDGRMRLSVDQSYLRPSNSSADGEAEHYISKLARKLRIRHKANRLIVSVRPNDFLEGLWRLLKLLIFAESLELSSVSVSRS